VLAAWMREKVPGADAAFETAERELRYGGLIAGGVAYRLFLWLVPLGLVLACLLGFWLDADPGSAEGAASEFGIGAASMAEASKVVEAKPENRFALLVVALWFLAWFTLGAVRALSLSYALAWDLERPKIPLLHAILLFNGLFVASTAGSLVLAWLRETIGLGALLGVAALLGLQTALALAASWFLPHRADRWQDLLPGAILIAVGLEAIHVATAFYFAPKLERSSELYGALGTATALLFWLYVVAMLVTTAAFLNATVWERRRRADEAPA
jgi:uncharacterized BrkB/YihY/UPF0761 family membrane protein